MAGCYDDDRQAGPPNNRRSAGPVCGYDASDPSRQNLSRSPIQNSPSKPTVGINTANADIAQLNEYESQAYQDALSAARAGDCAGPASPTTQPTIA
jgi:hypothetical protein